MAFNSFFSKTRFKISLLVNGTMFYPREKMFFSVEVKFATHSAVFLYHIQVAEHASFSAAPRYLMSQM